MITTVLLTIIALTVLIQPNAPRLFAALLFVGLTLIHEFFMSDLDGLAYYGSAALLDLGIIILTSGITPVPKMVIDLHRICMVSILINFIGWLIWLAYLPPAAYDSAFVILYLWAVYILINKDSADVGGFTMGGWESCFHFNTYSRISGIDRNGD